MCRPENKMGWLGGSCMFCFDCYSPCSCVETIPWQRICHNQSFQGTWHVGNRSLCSRIIITAIEKTDHPPPYQMTALAERAQERRTIQGHHCDTNSHRGGREFHLVPPQPPKPLNQGRGRTTRRSWVQVYPALTDHPRIRPSPARSNSLMTMLRLRQQTSRWKVDPPGSNLVLRRLTCDRAGNLSMWAWPRTYVFGGVQGLKKGTTNRNHNECPKPPTCLQRTNTWRSFQSFKIHPCPEGVTKV